MTSFPLLRYAARMSENEPKIRKTRKNRKKTEEATTEAAPNASQAELQPLVWISANQLEKIVKIMAAADGTTIKEAIDGINERLRNKELIIAPNFAKVEVRS